MHYAITTYTGRHMDPFVPRAQDICIADIAHALSLLTRAGGHLPVFYSVAQHCTACCREALARGETVQTALFCLLHDAAEAYMSDVIRPVKARMPLYREAEAKLLSLIYQTLAGAVPDTAQSQTVWQIDDAMLRAEFLHFMHEEIPTDAPPLHTNPAFSTLPFEKAETDFLQLFESLSGAASTHQQP